MIFAFFCLVCMKSSGRSLKLVNDEVSHYLDATIIHPYTEVYEVEDRKTPT